ncbi:hypothetical protein Hanom_Chr17g01564281 [Helianthus anomalus]
MGGVGAAQGPPCVADLGGSREEGADEDGDGDEGYGGVEGREGVWWTAKRLRLLFLLLAGLDRDSVRFGGQIWCRWLLDTMVVAGIW